jgi:hypothetical protein
MTDLPLRGVVSQQVRKLYEDMYGRGKESEGESESEEKQDLPEIGGLERVALKVLRWFR